MKEKKASTIVSKQVLKTEKLTLKLKPSNFTLMEGRKK